MSHVVDCFQIGLNFLKALDAGGGEPVIRGDTDNGKLVRSPFAARLVIGRDAFTTTADIKVIRGELRAI